MQTLIYMQTAKLYAIHMQTIYVQTTFYDYDYDYFSLSICNPYAKNKLRWTWMRSISSTVTSGPWRGHWSGSTARMNVRHSILPPCGSYSCMMLRRWACGDSSDHHVEWANSLWARTRDYRFVESNNLNHWLKEVNGQRSTREIRDLRCSVEMLESSSWKGSS